MLPRQEDLYTAVRLNDKETVKEVLDSMKVAGATGRESDGELPTAFVAAINVQSFSHIYRTPSYFTDSPSFLHHHHPRREL